MQPQAWSKAQYGGMEIGVEFFEDMEVRLFVLEKWDISAEGKAMNLFPRVEHGPMKGGHYVKLEIREEAIPETAQEVTCRMQFKLDQHHLLVSGAFRRDRSGPWKAAADSLKLVRCSDGAGRQE